ncbi:hypothetical protein BDEG_25820 [Batrachochytrium dendrobatidis JEL423]|uniref:RRM domain-containing protein n=2 Tax=Batrachochytrium dendrobatidis (strain JEL423) TaxID=403673 RepID=A0A177WRT4_BATDL|nr:hypothetical protein BDEG_25820 [Batrachochytrium dendrobatidis JEL423]
MVGAPLSVAASADKLVVSNLAFNVTEADVRELFSRIGPLRSAQLNYNSEGKSKGSATVIFNKHGDASKAFAEYNNRTLDERPMKIELIVNPGAPALRLGPATGTANSHRNSGSGGVTKTRGPARASGGGRGGRRAPKKPVTAADLDAEMDMYIAAPVSALIRQLLFDVNWANSCMYMISCR